MTTRSKLNADGSDPQYYLPRGVPPVNPWRMQHGQVRWEGEAIKALTWMPDMLNNTLDVNGNPCLTPDYIHTCESIFRIVTSARVALGLSDLRSFISANKTDAQSSRKTDPFFALLTGLLPYQSNLCLWVVCDEYNHGNIELAKRLIWSIRNSLDNAQKIIDNCRSLEENELVASPVV